MKSKDKVFQIAEEIVFVKVLASNSQHLRDRAVKKLGRWFAAKSSNPNTAFTDDDFIRIWEGLFYSMWMSDKPLIQEECAERISNLIHSFTTEDSALSFIRSFFHTMCNKWSSIDVFRLDKFAMLVRRFLRQCLVLSKKHNWNQKLPDEISLFINTSSLPQGLFFHFCDIFIEEICKVAGDDLSDDILVPFLKPFFKKLAETKNQHVASYMKESIVKHFIDLTDTAEEYRYKFRVWKRSGFKGGRISALQKVEPELEDEDDEEEEDGEERLVARSNENLSLDPRPGCVNVVLPIIKIDPNRYIQILEDIKKELNKKSNHLVKLFTKFYSLKRGEYPYGLKKVRKGPSLKDEVDAAVDRMVKEKLGEASSDEDNEEEEEKDRGRKNRLKRKRKDKHEPVDLDDLGDIVAGKKGRWNITNVKDKKQDEDKNETNSNQSVKAVAEWNVINVKDQKNKLNVKASKRLLHTTDTQQEWNIEPATSSQSVCSTGCKQNLNLLKDAGECWWRVLSLDGESTETNSKISNHKSAQPKKTKLNSGAKNGKLADSDLSSEKDCSSSAQCNGVQYNGELISSVLTVPNKLKHLTSSKQSAVVYPPMKTKEEIPLESTETPAKPQHHRLSELKTPGTGKRLSIRLDMNTAQDIEEHFATLASNPQVPFDAHKKPVQGVLKSSPVPSPINPFYGKRKRSLF